MRYLQQIPLNLIPLTKILVLSKICSKCKNRDEKTFKQEESIEIFKIIGLTNNKEGFQKI